MNVLLDEHQAQVSEATPEKRQLIVAGPGSGKTQTLSALVENLVLDEGLDTVVELLVLSFSNAAVHAVDARLRARDVPPVQVRTIDSLASIIIADLGEDPSLLSFDARVRRATVLLRERAWSGADDLLHVVVDEVQDVVGLRADFLMELVTALPEDSGFTFFGDPAQAIYDFQIDDHSGSTTTCQELLARAKELGAATIVLHGQYRASGADVLAAVKLRSQDGAELDIWGVEDTWNDLVDIGDVASAAALVKRWNGTTVFLTRTNGEALLVADALRKQGVAADVRRPANRQAPAAWIASLLGNHPAHSISKAEFFQLAEALENQIDASSAWRSLRAVAGSTGSELNLLSLASRLGERSRVPIALVAHRGNAVVVSTVHRAKGLEFDNVVYVEFEYRWNDDGNDDIRARERFVAMTRARDMLVRATWPEKVNIRRVDSRGSEEPRWVVAGPQKWSTFEFELRYGDVDTDQPPGEDQKTVQERLARGELTGAVVDLRRDSRRSTIESPVYAVLEGMTVIAHTSAEFGKAFASRVRLGKDRAGMWPDLTGVTVEGVVTAVGERTGTAVGATGLWLIPVLSGMGTIEWSKERG